MNSRYIMGAGVYWVLLYFLLYLIQITIVYCTLLFCTVLHCGTVLHHILESEIPSLIPHTPSSFPLFAVCSASDGKLGGHLKTRLLIQYSVCQ